MAKKLPISLYDTLSHKIQKFESIDEKENPLKEYPFVSMYTCGPTVYNYVHIGNLRTYIFEDILKRVLQYNAYQVKHVLNITDVGHLTDDADRGQDKMEKGSAREGKTAWEIAKFYTEAFKNDLNELNILFEPNEDRNILPDAKGNIDEMPKATENIPEQIALIEKLEKKGFTYTTSDSIYFDTSKLPDYGKLANLSKQELKAGARVDMGEKKNITDFALWKFSPTGEKRQMEWDSPLGIPKKGFPGWHIECSAMSVKYLGQPFDIHCGGIDHIPVHHTNEIAQSEAAEGKPLANYWMHGEFLLMGSDKMAKSGDNFVTLQTLKEHAISPLAYRYLLLQTHYRKQLTFSWDALQAAETGLRRLYESAWHIKGTSLTNRKKDNEVDREEIKNFLSIINDDLNIPEALGKIHNYIKDMGRATFSTILEFDKILGLEIEKGTEYYDNILKEINSPLPKEVEKIKLQRDTARASKNWAKSDELRKELEDLGYTVKDTPEGTQITKI